jgi:hypothetical protein
MKLLLPLLCVLALTGCANTGTHSIGKDTYMATFRVAFSGISGVQADALATASAHCESKGKAMLLGELTSNGCMLRGGCAEAQIVYSCLDKDDPRYKEPNTKRD